MKNLVTCAFAVTFGIGTITAETGNATKTNTPEERAARFQDMQLRRSGGMISQSGSAKGAFVVLNAQKRVPVEVFNGIMTYLDGKLQVVCKIASTENVAITNIEQKISENGGTIGVAVVDDPALPALLTAPETHWSVINVAKLSEKCHDKACLASRVRKEILRSLAFTSGCAYMTIGDPLMRDVITVSDLDGLSENGFGIEILSRFASTAPLYGLKPRRIATYRKACEEGWAPAPTNKYQKAIWNKVHALPTEPIKITPETKKVRE